MLSGVMLALLLSLVGSNVSHVDLAGSGQTSSRPAPEDPTVSGHITLKMINDQGTCTAFNVTEGTAIKTIKVDSPNEALTNQICMAKNMNNTVTVTFTMDAAGCHFVSMQVGE